MIHMLLSSALKSIYMSPIPHCIIKVELIQNTPVFSCYTLPHISFISFTPIFYLTLHSVIFICSVLLFLLCLRGFIQMKRQLSETHVLLEIIPPSDTKQTTLTTEQFMTNLHSIGQNRSWFDKLVGKKNIFSLELIATKEKGIRYVLGVPKEIVPIIKRQVLSFLKGATITDTDDSLQSINKPTHGMIRELTFQSHYVYSLQEQSSLSQYDPIAYMTGHMTRLGEHETILLQIVITPVTKSSHWSIYTFIQKTIHRIELGEDVSENIKSHHSLSATILMTLLLSVPFILFAPYTIISQILRPTKDGNFFPLWLYTGEKKNPMDRLTPEKQEIQRDIAHKLQKELFETTIRIYSSHEDRQGQKERMQGILSSFQPLHTHLQRLHTKFSIDATQWIQEFFLMHRILAFKGNPILSVSELANLYHFPYTPITHTEDLVQSKNQELPVPLSLKNSTDLAITFATNSYGGIPTSIGQDANQRRKHTYIIGGTGTGKTTLLYTMIMQDIIAGHGINVTDPHGDLIQKILQTIPENRQDDVVLFDPDDTEHPCGFNILEMPQVLSKEEMEKYKDQLCGILIATFQKLFPSRVNAYRMEHILRQAILTVLETESPTLFTIQKLLTDYKYRKSVVEQLTDPILINFWKKEFASMGSMQRADATSPITTRLGEFFASHMARNILLQKHTTIDFTDIMNNKKILLCDLSKGKITESMSSFFGALITAQIEITAQQRARLQEKDRVDFYVYIDEFQNFATPSFAQMMGESRKYRLNTILAHQTIAQIEDTNFIDIVLANTGTVISFHTGSPRDERYLLPFFVPEVLPGQLNSLPPYHFYIKISNSTPATVFTGQTEILIYPENQERANSIRELSRNKYTKQKSEIEREIVTLLEDNVSEKNTADAQDQLQKAKEYHLKDGGSHEKK